MDTLVVSCFYLVKPKPQRSHNLYKEWFKNFVSCLSTNVLIFTDETSKLFLNFNHEKVIYKILPFNELHYVKNYDLNFWEQQQKRDLNKDRVWQLSVLYNEKSHFVKRAAKLYQNTKWFIWCDLGCFREKTHFDFPQVSHLSKDKITLLQINKFKRKELQRTHIFHPEKQVRIGGGVQVATREVWAKWVDLYDDIFKVYLQKSTVNCDQGLLASIIIQNKNLAGTIKAKKTSLTKDKWFYLLEYCSDQYVKKKSENKNWLQKILNRFQS